MTGADDWTLEIEEKGLPDLERLYALLGAEGLVAARTFPQFGHNYNSVSRTVMYDWLNRHLGLGHPEPVLEKDYRPLTREDASPWNAEHPAPHGDQVGDPHERDVLEWMTGTPPAAGAARSRRRGTHELREVVGGAFDTILVRRLDDVGQAYFEATVEREVEGSTLTLGRLRNEGEGEELPVLILQPLGGPRRGVVIWIHERGKDGLLGSSGLAPSHSQPLESCCLMIAYC